MISLRSKSPMRTSRLSRTGIALMLSLIVASAMTGSIAGARQNRAPDPAPVLPDVTPVLPTRPDPTATPDSARDANADANDARSHAGSAVFESLAAGIRFTAPAGAKETPPTGAAGDEIAQYVNEAEKWVVRVARLRYNEPIAMTYHKRDDKPGSPDVNGLLEETVGNLKRDRADLEILRQEVVRTGSLDIGIIAGRFKIGADHNVTQIALVRQIPADAAIDGARLYFTFSLTVAATKGEDVETDPNVRRAVEAFNRMIDSVELLDQTAIREDQNQRLYKTRSLFVSLTDARLKQALVREQWLRLTKDGKEIGYSYIVEQTGRDLPRSRHRDAVQTGGQDGVLIGVRSRTTPESGVKVDGESWMWTSFDRKHEKWSNVRIIDSPVGAPRTEGQAGRPGGSQKAGGDQAPGGKDLIGDYGSSDANIRLVKDENLEEGERIGPGKVDASQPKVRQAEVLTLNVTHVGRDREEAPVYRELPPFYLSQALAHLLPRLVAGGGAKGYLFAMYNGEDRQVMMRYVDVRPEKNAVLGGKTVRAIPVEDRWGMEGSVTTHYVSPKGEYLGSVNLKSGITVLPTDSATLEKIWKDVNLTPPGAVDERK